VPEPARLHPVSRRHLEVLTTDIGIMQHARGARPDPDHGYCTDDVARGLLVDVLHQRPLGWRPVEASVTRGLWFLRDAFDGSSGRFRNLRRSDGTWLAAAGSEDADARALQALAELIATAPPGHIGADATSLFRRAFPTASQVGSLRPLATVMLACAAAEKAGLGSEVVTVAERVADELEQRFSGCNDSLEWPWPEEIVTYENELPAAALITAGRILLRPRLVAMGTRVLDWLIDAQTLPDGRLRTVGNDGWWPKGGFAARFDQQAISVTTVLLAAEIALEATDEPRYGDTMEAAYGWFLGRNDAHEPVADPRSGACGDGIGPAGVSRNQGAESTLMWLTALEHIRSLRARLPLPAAARKRELVAVA
jgi:hypothetical protein